MTTDAEVICSFMEPKPTEKPSPYGANLAWWAWNWRYVGPSLPQQQTPVEYGWHPRVLTLNECHKVEERLIGLGFRAHLDSAISLEVWHDAVAASTWHATAEQKITALAAVLRAKNAEVLHAAE